MDFDATVVPQDLVAALGLEWPLRYELQNLGSGPTLFIRQSLVAPSITERAFRVESGGRFVLQPPIGGPSLWVWTDDDRGCQTIVGLA